MKPFEKELQTEPKHTNDELYEKQMELLKTFLEHGAISQAQYDKSSHDLTVKIGFEEQKR